MQNNEILKDKKKLIAPYLINGRFSLEKSEQRRMELKKKLEIAKKENKRRREIAKKSLSEEEVLYIKIEVLESMLSGKFYNKEDRKNVLFKCRVRNFLSDPRTNPEKNIVIKSGEAYNSFKELFNSHETFKRFSIVHYNPKYIIIRADRTLLNIMGY